MLRVLNDYLKTDLRQLKILDVGSSTGRIASCLADHFGYVFGVDTDRPAVGFARQNSPRGNLRFALADGMNLSFRDEVFDVAICAHIYEHVADAARLLNEIHRVLKPDGICYFAADNLLRVREPHYGLPFLAFFPGRLSNLYLRLAGRGDAYEIKLLTHRSLRRLVERFAVIDYTARIIQNPGLFQAEYMLRAGSLKFKFANLVVRYAYGLCPSYVWLLQKRSASGS